MAAALKAGLTLDEFLDDNFERCELLGGEARPKPLPTIEHSRMQRRLLDVLGGFYGADRVLPEMNVVIGEEILVPDVAVLDRRDPGVYRGNLIEPPLLCVEILSPSQRPEEMFAKCRRYREFRVRFCWVVDPVSHRAWEQSWLPDFQEVTGSFATPQPIALAALFE